MRLLVTIQLSVAVALAAVAGCATRGDAESGTLQIPLVQSDGAGGQYRLSAQFAIAGPDGTLTVDGNVDAPAVSVSLAPGDYTVAVLDGWHLERSVNGQPFAPIDAQLSSANPVQVTIAPAGAATVVFYFLVELATHGSLTITFGVLPARARLLGTLHATDATGALAGYIDHPAAFVILYSADVEIRGFFPPRYHEVVSGLNHLRFTDDPLGLLVATGPASGGFLEYRIDVQPDDSQALLLIYNTPDGGLSLVGTATSFVPKVPIEDLGAPADPGSVGLSTSVSFMLTADQDSMTGTIDLQFVPAE
jgi:hypothetical protein